MTKHLTRSLNSLQSPKHSPSASRRSPKAQFLLSKSRKIQKHERTPSQSTARHTTHSEVEAKELKPVYKTTAEAKSFSLILIQELVKASSEHEYSYCLMLEILSGLEFEGLSDLSLKVAITIFHLAAKFYSVNAPKLD